MRYAPDRNRRAQRGGSRVSPMPFITLLSILIASVTVSGFLYHRTWMRTHTIGHAVFSKKSFAPATSLTQKKRLEKGNATHSVQNNQTQETPTVHFDFYTVLPEQKVEISVLKKQDTMIV